MKNKKLALVIGIVTCIFGLVAVIIAQADTPTILPTPTPTLPPTPTVDHSEYLQIFEAVWSKVNQTFYDPNFGGVDWAAVHDEYEPLIAASQDDDTFYDLLNRMLWELNVSHVGVGPAEVWPSIEPAAWANGDIGIDVRLLGDQAVITRVEADSPAEKAGLKAGFIIQSVDGSTVEQILAEMEEPLSPPHTEAGRIDILTRHLISKIYGDPGTCVNLGYLDGKDRTGEVCVERARRTWLGDMGGVIPPAFLEFESKRLESGSGYIRFNTFHPYLIPDMVKAVAELQDAPGIIIDLRGNPGGDPTTAEALAAEFLAGEVSFGSFTFRDGSIPRPVIGKNTYTGVLVVLIDKMSFSASEYFSSGMQAADRAVIIGEHSPGGLTAMNFEVLPNDALLGYPVAQLVTSDGRVLEGVGVTPDVTVALDRDQLLEGIDAQLQAAIDFIRETRSVAGCTVFTVSKGDQIYFGGNDGYINPDSYYWVDPVEITLEAVADLVRMARC